MIVYWTNEGTKTGPCAACSVFIGKHWHIDQVPTPPLHPQCACVLVPADNAIPELALGPISEHAREILLRLVMYYLVVGINIPPLLSFLIPEAEKELRNNSMIEPERIRTEFTAEGDLIAVLVEPGRTRTITDGPGRHTFTAEAINDAYDRGLFAGLSCFIDHAEGHPSIRNLLGTWTDVTNTSGRITAKLTTFQTEETRPTLQLLDQLRALPLDQRPDVGLSLVLYTEKVTATGEIQKINKIESADLVLFPAVPSARFIFHSHGEEEMTEKIAAAGTAEKTWPTQPDPAWDKAYRSTAAAAIVNNSDLPALVKTRLNAGDYATPEDVFKAIEDARAELASLHDAQVINLPGRPRIQTRDPLEEAQEAMSYFFGLSTATTPPANMRRFDELYVAMTGDVHMRGVFDDNRKQFAAADTTTLANTAADAMNKVMVEQMIVLDHWRWYERVTSVEPNNGTLHNMKWITLGGIGNLPTVAEGAAYTELSVDDAEEEAAFTKVGGYVGITREMIKNSDIIRMQAVPRALANAAVRTRSAAVSALFTSNSGVGPTLAQDSTALFDTATHVNLLTTALGTDATAWRAARAECFQHTELHSGKVLGIYPRFLLVPAELYDVALSILGYGEGMPTSYTPEAQSRGFADPRPIPLVVPDWTDATDWAYIVDPAIFPVIQMSYSQNPGGRRHPAPELFAVQSQTSGLLFTNDTLPIKVRDEFAVGVNGYRGIGKRNVAG